MSNRESDGDGYAERVYRGTYGDLRINPDALGNDYEVIDDDGNLKAKVWESDNGDRRLYLRIRDYDDGRRFNEYSVGIETHEHGQGIDHLDDRTPLAYAYDGDTLEAIAFTESRVFGLGHEPGIDVVLTPAGEEVDGLAFLR